MPTTTFGSGDATFTVSKSAEVTTVVVAVALSKPGDGSVVAEVTVAVFEIIVAAATPDPTATTSVKTELPNPAEAFEQLTVPPEPTAGVVQVQPPGELNDTNVVPAGNVSLMFAVAALLGPAFVTVMV